MKDIKVYTGSHCWFCEQAKTLLKRLNLPFEEINLDNEPELRRQLSEENNGFRTIPMIFVDNQFVGGFQELVRWQKEGKL